MKSYCVFFYPDAEEDAQQVQHFYEDKQAGLGDKFYQALEHALSRLKMNPFYQIRYDKMRCLLIKGFPYLIHFKIDENESQINIFAIISTHQNPDAAWIKQSQTS